MRWRAGALAALLIVSQGRHSLCCVPPTHTPRLTHPPCLQTAITKDNVSLTIDGVLYVMVIDAFRASYGVENALFAVTQLAQVISWQGGSIGRCLLADCGDVFSTLPWT